MNFLPFLIAKRFYLKKRKTHLILLISIFSKIGISISIFALIISFSALNGFKILLNEKILSTLPHGIIQLTNQSLITIDNMIKKLNTIPDVTYCEPYMTTNGVLIKKNNLKLIEIKSFSDINYLEKKISLQNEKTHFSKKNFPSHLEIIISSNLAKNLSIKKNDFLELLILNQKKKFSVKYQVCCCKNNKYIQI